MYCQNNLITKIDLNKEYSPSKCTHRFKDAQKPNEAVIENFIIKGKLDTEKARQIFQVKRNVRYSKDMADNQLLDIYFEKQENCTPIFVYIHGGYWSSLDISTSGSVIQPLIKIGYRVVCADYNICPKVDLETLTKQIGSLFEWLKIYSEETQAPEVVICGHSAGAHLAFEVFRSPAMKTINIKNIILISGLYDLRELWQLESCNTGNILGLNKMKAIELSPICWMTNFSNEFFQLHPNLRVSVIAAEFDSQTFQEQSRSISEILSKVSGNFGTIEFSILKGYDHFNIIEEMNDSNSAVSNYIKDRLLNSSKVKKGILNKK